jgi:hypothetical protein
MLYKNQCQAKNKKFLLIPTSTENEFNIRLIGLKKNPFIGKLNLVCEGTFLTNRNDNQILRKNNSIGLNYDLLTDETLRFKWISINYNGNILVTSRSYFLSHGKCYQFKGLDLQCFLPINLFGIHKAREYEAQLIIQLSLFGEVI